MKKAALKPIEFSRTEFGWSAQRDGVTMLFGDKSANLSVLARMYPETSFSFLSQTHSDKALHVKVFGGSPFTVIYKATDWPVADAHWTQTRGIALCVRTADCLPILIQTDKAIAAIHAGWRGLEAELIQKTLAQMAKNGINISTACAVIGPHINRSHFEVGRDVAERLNSVFRKLRYNPEPISSVHEDPEKRYVDMAILAKAQLIQSGVDEYSIWGVQQDTFAESALHSFRRDGERSGRQISFICLR